MTPAEVLTLISLINGLFTFLKNLPDVIAEIKSLVARVQPHVEGAGAEAVTQFAALQEKLAAVGVAPTGLTEPVPADPRLAQLIAQRNAARAATTVAQARADDADRKAQTHQQLAEKATADRDAFAKRAQDIAAENETLKGQLGASEVARQKAERATQDAQQAAQHAREALAAATAAAAQAKRK